MSTLLSSPQTFLEMKGRINLWPQGPVVVADFSEMRPTGGITNIARDQNYPLPTHEQTSVAAAFNAGGRKFVITSPKTPES